jgi:hypothetical protein
VQLQLGETVLVFPAVSFLMLGYGQRYVAITGRIRQLVSDAPSMVEVDRLRLAQVEVLRRRVGIIRLMQTLAVVSLVFGLASSLMVLIDGHQPTAKVVFGCSLIAMVASLVTTVWEIQLSTVAVDLQIESAELQLSRRVAP